MNQQRLSIIIKTLLQSNKPVKSSELQDHCQTIFTDTFI